MSFSYNDRLRVSLGILDPVATFWAQTYGYDLAKRLTNVTSVAGAFGYAYDATRKARVAVLSLSGGSIITNGFESVARLTGTFLKNSGGSTLNSHTYTINLAGQRTVQTRVDGSYVSYRYDNAGELISARAYEVGGAGASGYRTNEFFSYGYDAAGNLQYRTNSGLVQTFSVNADNELTTVARSGTLTVSGTTATNATSVTVNGSTATRYGDATFALGGFTITNGVNSYTAIGQDAIGRKDTNTVSVNLPSTVSFEYDLNGNLLGDGLRSYDYDDENQLIRVTTGSTAKSEFVYDGRLRRRITRDFVWGTVGGAVSSMVTNVVLSTTVRSNLTGWAGLRFAVGSSPVVVTALGRWVVSGNSGSHALKLVRSDGNDVPGATATVTLSGISTNQFSYATLSTPVVLEANTTYFLVSQEVTNGEKWYDYNSTLTPISGFTINGTVWALNGTTSYTVTAGTNSGYIPVNLKFTTGGWNLAGETHYIYDGMTVVQERDQNNVPLVTYTRGQDLSGSLQGAGGIGGLLARTDQTASAPSHAYYHADGNGSITAMVSFQQNLVAKYLYDPYGNILAKSGLLADANVYRFSSKEWHPGSTLYYYGYRHYNPDLQRWPNRDPIHEFGFLALKGRKLGFHVGSELNLYTFVGNDPIMYIDYAGLTKRFGGLTGGKCCNSSKEDQWWMDDGVWHKLPPGKCTGTWDDCDGMTCGGGYYYIQDLEGGDCKTPGNDCDKFKRRRWTPTHQGPDARSPKDRGAPTNDPPPGYGWSTN